jgi:GH18 family chitinase
MSLAEAGLKGGAVAGLPAGKLTLGLPFYGRHSATGDWVTWEDLQQKHALKAGDDAAPAEGGIVHFNGRATIMEKVRRAAAAGVGGVMIWEAGQDCRQEAVTRGGQTHKVTCTAGADSSLLVAMTAAIKEGRQDL